MYPIYGVRIAPASMSIAVPSSVCRFSLVHREAACSHMQTRSSIHVPLASVDIRIACMVLCTISIYIYKILCAYIYRCLRVIMRPRVCAMCQKYRIYMHNILFAKTPQQEDSLSLPLFLAELREHRETREVTYIFE